MELFFSPLACSLATRVCLYEAQAQAHFIQVDLHAKRIVDNGQDFLAFAPMGQVPVLRTLDGRLLAENTAILQYVAEQYPEAKLTPQEASEQPWLRQWLGFIGTELHKGVFVPLLDPKAPDGAKAYARDKLALRMRLLQDRLSEHDFLLGDFSVADAYLVTVLNWATYCGVALDPWPGVDAYFRRLAQRPSVARALHEESVLYRAEQAAHAARRN